MARATTTHSDSDDLVGRVTRGECWFCTQFDPDLRAAVDKARRDCEAAGRRLGPDTVIKWLVEEKGYAIRDLKRGSINYHFQRGHHLQEAADA